LKIEQGNTDNIQRDSRNTRRPSAYRQWYAYHRLKTTAVYSVVFRLETSESSRFMLAL